MVLRFALTTFQGRVCFQGDISIQFSSNDLFEEHQHKGAICKADNV